MCGKLSADKPFQVVYVVKTQILRVLEWGSKPHLGAKGQTAKHIKSSYLEEFYVNINIKS